MLDTSVAWLANQGMNFLATGENPRPARQPASEHRAVSGVPDGGRLHGAVDRQRSDLQAVLRQVRRWHICWRTTRFATNAARVRNRQLVTDTLTPVMQQHPTGWWIDRLEALKIGCGPINKLTEVFADPQVQARGVVVEMAHPLRRGTVKMIANPVRLSETPADYRSRRRRSASTPTRCCARGWASAMRRSRNCAPRSNTN